MIAALAADGDFAQRRLCSGAARSAGAAARAGRSATDPAAADTARRSEIQVALALLRNAAAGDSANPGGWIIFGSPAPHAGFAAVESPRGRLHYLLAVQGEGRLQGARVLAPTEWNFHPAGPLAHALRGMRAGSDPAQEIARRAAAFDPCVACRVVVEEAGHA